MSKLPKRKRMTPQEKKRMSLLKDRRERSGQNDKASRKLVPLRKGCAPPVPSQILSNGPVPRWAMTLPTAQWPR